MTASRDGTVICQCTVHVKSFMATINLSSQLFKLRLPKYKLFYSISQVFLEPLFQNTGPSFEVSPKTEIIKMSLANLILICQLQKISYLDFNKELASNQQRRKTSNSNSYE